MIARLLVLGVLALGVLAARDVVGMAGTGSAGAASSSVDRVVVDPHRVVRTIPADFFGINSDGFWDGAELSATSARALAQTPIRTVRFPGGAPADWYDWQDPFYKGWSRTTPLQLWRYARKLGATRVLFGTNYQGHEPNPPGKPYAVNSPANAAAWVRYNRSAGIAADMEVGNEEDMNLLHKADDPAYQAYVRAFNAQARAMHRANPRVRVLGPVGTNEYFWWGLDGLGEFLEGAGNRTGSGQADGISLHFYKGSGWLDTRNVAQYWLSGTGPWAAIQTMIRAHDTRKLPVYITEWNLGGADQKSAFNPTLGHALANADMIGAFALSGVAGEDYFDTHGSSTWGLLYGQGDARPLDSPTPTYYAMALWKHMGSRVLGMQQSDDAGSVMSTYATKKADGSVQVLAINKQPKARKVSIELQGASTKGHRLRVYSLRGTSGAVDDVKARYDGVVMPSTQKWLPGPRDLGIVRGRTVMYRVPGYSAVVLDLRGTTANKDIRWNTVSTTTPVSPQFSIRGRVSSKSPRRGGMETLSATVRSSEDTGSVLVDLEVYDAAGKKVFQGTRMVDLRAGRAAVVRQRFSIGAAAAPGTYAFDIGVFGTSWSPLYGWKANADSFNVRG